MKEHEDLVGKNFGRLTVVSKIGYDSDLRKTIWECKCSCGKTKNIPTSSLKSGNTLSCGCLRKEIVSQISKTHGDSGKCRLYSIWHGIKNRCYNSNVKAYKNYGGRGIEMCDEWKDNYECFREWALENGYKDDLTIDRIDNDGNYCPENCKWSTRHEQCNNMRSNVLITYNGETHTATEWSKITGIKSSVLTRRKKRGWTDIECIETPAIHHANRYVRKNNKKG